jgi:hypothetical protein
MRKLERVELARSDAIRAMAEPEEVVRIEERIARIKEGLRKARVKAVRLMGDHATSADALTILTV